mgnify:CR=1|jgi:opacity protein-like surface antigen
MKKMMALLAAVACAGAAADPQAGYLELAVGTVQHGDGDLDESLDKGVAVDFAVGINQVINSRFNNGVKLTIDNVVDGEAEQCTAQGCETDDFHITTLGLNYDLDWRFVRPLSLLASAGVGGGWSSIFPDNVEFMIRSSIGLSFHAGERFQIVLGAVNNYFPAIAEDTVYSLTRWTLGLRFDFE